MSKILQALENMRKLKEGSKKYCRHLCSHNYIAQDSAGKFSYVGFQPAYIKDRTDVFSLIIPIRETYIIEQTFHGTELHVMETVKMGVHRKNIIFTLLKDEYINQSQIKSLIKDQIKSYFYNRTLIGIRRKEYASKIQL